MRTSRIARDTAKVMQALTATNRPRRKTRAPSTPLRGYSTTEGRPVSLKREDDQTSDTSLSSPESVFSEDIEDIVREPPKKRKRGNNGPSSTITRISTTTTIGTTISSCETTKTEELDESPSKVQRLRRVPAREVMAEDGTVTIHPPSNWREVYNTIHAMRKRNPTAPVDTMGCEDLYHESSSPRDRRFQTLVALMLSSQTKDTVTSVAMQRLHSYLVQSTKSASSNDQSYLNLENILAVPPARLNELIGAVGFHNNKTKYIKAAALMLLNEYNGDIPNTPEGLMRLPGVGPKMAYLCMSAAWGIDMGIGVDVHVHRITNLFGWHRTKTPEETRAWLEGWLPKDKWHEINKMLVGLGQTVCLPVGRRCDVCDLGGTCLCPGEVRSGKVKRKKLRQEVILEKAKVGEDIVKNSIKEEVVEELP